MIKDLIRLANHLDSIGLHKEADTLDKVAITLQPDEDYDEDITNAGPIIDAVNNLIARVEMGAENDPAILEDERARESAGDHRLYAKLYEELESEIFNLAEHMVDSGGTIEDVASQLEEPEEGSFGYYLEKEIVGEYVQALIDIANKLFREELPPFKLDPKVLISKANKALISEPLPEAPF